jgi:UDP-N-acetyl-D-mannosaminuronate dehydrogenase
LATAALRLVEKALVIQSGAVASDITEFYGLNPPNAKMDCVIVTTAHDAFKQMKLDDLARMI